LILSNPLKSINDLRKEVADRRSLLWDNVRRFDQDTSNSFDLWDKLPEEVQDQYCEGYDLWDTDPEGAFALFELSCCERGNGTAKDGKRAKQFFRDAVEAGSWHATIHYARFLERAGDQELAYLTLEDGVDAEYTAAYFWLAWLWREKCFQWSNMPQQRGIPVVAG